MKLVFEKARSVFRTAADVIRHLLTSLPSRFQSISEKFKAKNFSFHLSALTKASQKKLRIQQTKEYFRKHSHRKKKNLSDDPTGYIAASADVQPPSGFKQPLSLDGASVFNGMSSKLRTIKDRIKENGSTSNWKYVFGGLAVILCIAGIGGLSVANSSEKAVAVKVNGKQVAVVTSKVEAEKILNQLEEQKAKLWKKKLKVNERVTFENITAKKYQICSNEDLQRALEKNLSFVGVITGIKANGKLIAVVQDAASANKVFDEIKKKFTANINNMQIESVAFGQKIEIVDIPATINDVQPIEQVVQKIVNGEQKAKVHVVQEGDSLWSIARKYDMHVTDLKSANPSLDGEDLDIGQELKLMKVEPLLTVVINAKATVQEVVAFNVKVETDRSLMKGNQKVKQKGENGSREVTYRLVVANGEVTKRIVLNEKVLKPARDQVVVRGAKLVLASRGGRGRLAWPTGGHITSRFGRRWGRMHTGLDIDGYTGQSVGAAEDGVVVSAGWDGAYGKQVTIRHSNGVKTKYAHLSSINVHVGEHVSRGELIGKVGSTGRSTGSHLHFEVTVGGSYANPLKYLK